MKRMTKLLAATAALATMSGAAWAHHSTAAYDFAKSVTLQGTVRSFQWGNPHNYVQIVVADGKGGEQEWAVEVGTPVTATRMGWSSNSFKQGDKVTLVIAPMKDGSPAGTVKTATLADGTTLKSVAADARAASPFDAIPSLQRATPKQP